MADVPHSGTSITGGHTNAVAAGAAGFMTGADKTKLNGVATGADVTNSNPPQAHAASHKLGGSDVILLNELGLPTAAVTANNQDISGIKQSYLNSEINDGNSGTTKAIDWTQGPAHRLTLTGNVTLTFTAPAAPCWLQLKVIQDGTGGRTVTYPTASWVNKTAHVATPAIAAVDIVSLWYDGSAYWGSYMPNMG